MSVCATVHLTVLAAQEAQNQDVGQHYLNQRVVSVVSNRFVTNQEDTAQK